MFGLLETHWSMKKGGSKLHHRIELVGRGQQCKSRVKGRHNMKRWDRVNWHRWIDKLKLSLVHCLSLIICKLCMVFLPVSWVYSERVRENQEGSNLSLSVWRLPPTFQFQVGFFWKRGGKRLVALYSNSLSFRLLQVSTTGWVWCPLSTFAELFQIKLSKEKALTLDCTGREGGNRWSTLLFFFM